MMTLRPRQFDCLSCGREYQRCVCDRNSFIAIAVLAGLIVLVVMLGR